MSAKFEVTLKDKNKAKTTCKIFGGLSLFFAISAILVAAFTPHSQVIKGINNDSNDRIRTFTEINYANEYAVFSNSTLQTYNLEDSSLLSSIEYANQIKSLVNSSSFSVSSFEEPTAHYHEESDGKGYLLLIDNDGDIFRYNYDNGHLTLSNDYWLTDRITIDDVLYKQKYETRALDIASDGTLYMLQKVDNIFVVNSYDTNDLSSGIKSSKTFYTLLEPDKDQKINYGKNVYLVNPINSEDKGENPYNISVYEDYLYVFTAAGMHRMSLDLKDFESDCYFSDGENYFTEKLRSELLAMSNDEKASLNIDDNFINSASSFIVNQIYKSHFGTSQYIAKETFYANEYESSKDWVVSYDPSLKSETLVIKKDHVDASKNVSIYINSQQTLGGTAFDPNTHTLYYLNLRDNTIYSADVLDAMNYEVMGKATLSDIASSTNITYKRANFYGNRGNIGYDHVSNTIHVSFFSSRKTSIIDLNGDAPKIQATLTFQYDTRAYIQSKDGTRLAGLYQTEKRTIKNVASFPLFVGVVDIQTYKNRGAFVGLFIASIVLLLLSSIVFFIALKALKDAKKLLKCKVIGRDFKRNKWTYVALIPFIVLLIMFCYIEAVGSISFSFFSYTQQKPSYLWNTFGNYIEIFNNKDFWKMMGNTLFFLVFDLFLGIVPPIFFAFCLSIIKNKKLSGVMRAAMFIPAIVPGIATLLIWKIGIFGDTGVLNQIVCLIKTGHTADVSYTPIQFLHSEKISRWSLLLMGFPYVGGYLIFYGGIMNIPKEYDEACQLEGLGVVERFITIDLPLIKPQIKYIFVMGILNSVQNYERTYMLGSNGTITLVESMYRQMKDVPNPNYGLASAYATLIFIMLLFPVLWNFRKTKKDALGDML